MFISLTHTIYLNNLAFPGAAVMLRAEEMGCVIHPSTLHTKQSVPGMRNLQLKPMFRESWAQALPCSSSAAHLHHERACTHHLRDKMCSETPPFFCTSCLIWTQRCCAVIKLISSRVRPCLCLPALFSWDTSWWALQACQTTAAFVPLRQEDAYSNRTEVPLGTNYNPL